MRKNILVKNIDLLRSSFQYALNKYKFKIIAICVMENHIHMILNIANIEEYPKIIYSIKYYFSHRLSKDSDISESKNKKGEKGIWQRRYWEHTIRDEKDLNKHIDYIHYNPMKHYNVPPKDWQYSTFRKFVNDNFYDIDWCNQKDENNIIELDFE